MTREEAMEIIMSPDGGLEKGSPEEREFSRMLESSQELREVQKQQQAVWSAMELWESVEPSMNFDRQIRERVEELSARRSWFGGWFPAPRPGLAMALTALFVVAAGVVRQQPRLGPATVAGVLETAADEVYFEEFSRALDDLEMLAELDIAPQLESGQDQS
jgi:hypothetical protein